MTLFWGFLDNSGMRALCPDVLMPVSQSELLVEDEIFDIA